MEFRNDLEPAHVVKRTALSAPAALLGAALIACSVPHATSPPLIVGGRFEASGVVNVPASNGVLFVDDNSPSLQGCL